MSDTAAPPAPLGLVPYINVENAIAAMDFYVSAFAATETGRNLAGESNRLMHGALEINGSPLYLSDFFPDHGFPAVAPQGFNLHLQVSDARFWFDRAVAAGCTVLTPLKQEFWGDIYGQLRDPFGITWAIGQGTQSS